jgi:hypothetical protein
VVREISSDNRRKPGASQDSSARTVVGERKAMSLLQDITALSKPYLGAEAEPFIARQCKTYLNIDPAALEKKHLAALADWVETGAARFVDNAKAKELAAKIARL